MLAGDAPVLLASELGDGHYDYILPAAYFTVDDNLHAYVVGFGPTSGDQEVFHAVSADGLEWTVDDEDPFRDLGLELLPPGPIPTSILKTDAGYVMYLWASSSGTGQTSQIWRATASKPEGPWRADPEPVLPVGPAGAWDDGGLDFPTVVATQDGYSMLYSANGGTSPQAGRIGLATSTDGSSWERMDEPVISAGLCPYDAEYTAAPRLTEVTDGYLVLYNEDRNIGAATAGPDLLDWQCTGTAPLLSAADVPNGQGIHTFATTQVGGHLSVLIESLVEGASELWLGEVEDPENL